eukprot:1785612-Rhodomonas_salina.4
MPLPGAIAVLSCSLVVDGDVTMIANYADDDGGAILAIDCDVSMSGGALIEENEAGDNGGGLLGEAVTVKSAMGLHGCYAESGSSLRGCYAVTGVDQAYGATGTSLRTCCCTGPGHGATGISGHRVSGTDICMAVQLTLEGSVEFRGNIAADNGGLTPPESFSNPS